MAACKRQDGLVEDKANLMLFTRKEWAEIGRKPLWEQLHPCEEDGGTEQAAGAPTPFPSPAPAPEPKPEPEPTDQVELERKKKLATSVLNNHRDRRLEEIRNSEKLDLREARVVRTKRHYQIYLDALDRWFEEKMADRKHWLRKQEDKKDEEELTRSMEAEEWSQAEDKANIDTSGPKGPGED